MFKAALKIVGLSVLLSGLVSFSNTPVEAKRFRLMCQGDHLHYGSSSGYPRRALAIRAATHDWGGFTAFEYGNHFAHWKLAKNKRVSCNRSAGGWNCSVEATPCRRN